MRLKEKTKAEGKEDEAKEEVEEEKPAEVLARVQKEFFEVIENELRRRERAKTRLKSLGGQVRRCCQGKGRIPEMPLSTCHLIGRVAEWSMP